MARLTECPTRLSLGEGTIGGYVPHFDGRNKVQVITYRLADSLPQAVVDRLRHVHTTDLLAFRAACEVDMDRGAGECWLARDDIAEAVVQAWRHFDGQRYRLSAWGVMPNHVHVMAEVAEGYRLGDIVHSWKSFTAHRINEFLSRDGVVWQPDYWDRYVRDANHYAKAKQYIEGNPAKAGLERKASQWRWSSAYGG